MDFIYSNSSDQVDIIYLDIKKAFDSIPHNKLLSTLYSHGIQGNLWKWFKSYLTGRTQHAHINWSLSTPLPVLSGVPQGSILGPLLFIMYMNDLPAYLSMSKSLLFINDKKIYNIVTNPQDCAALQNNLGLAKSWSEKWDVYFNPTTSV